MTYPRLEKIIHRTFAELTLLKKKTYKKKFQQNLSVLLFSMLLLLLLFTAHNILYPSESNKLVNSTDQTPHEALTILRSDEVEEPVHHINSRNNSAQNNSSNFSAASQLKQPTVNNQSANSGGANANISSTLQSKIENYIDEDIGDMSAEDLFYTVEELYGLEEVNIDDLVEFASNIPNTSISTNAYGLILDSLDDDDPRFTNAYNNMQNMISSSDPETRKTALSYYLDYGKDVSEGQIKSFYAQETSPEIRADLISKMAWNVDSVNLKFLEQEAANPNNSKSVREAAEQAVFEAMDSRGGYIEETYYNKY